MTFDTDCGNPCSPRPRQLSRCTMTVKICTFLAFYSWFWYSLYFMPLSDEPKQGSKQPNGNVYFSVYSLNTLTSWIIWPYIRVHVSFFFFFILVLILFIVLCPGFSSLCAQLRPLFSLRPTRINVPLQRLWHNVYLDRRGWPHSGKVPVSLPAEFCSSDRMVSLAAVQNCHYLAKVWRTYGKRHSGSACAEPEGVGVGSSVSRSDS